MNTVSRSIRASHIAYVCVAIAMILAIGALVDRKAASPPRQTLGISTASAQSAPATAPKPNPDREAYFGQTHLHTSWSPDAYIFGNRLTGPAEAYQYAMGQPIKHPAGYEVKIRTPLDFQGVTDHAEYVGVMRLANDSSSSISKLPIAQKLQVKTEADATHVFEWLAASLGKNQPITELLTPEIKETIWKQTIAIADEYNKPGKFTAFVAYEWTSMPGNRNLHRNIFFRDSKHVPVAPFSAIDSTHPEDLWAWMDAQRKQGNELLAISHNANLSDGLMFPMDVDSKGRPIDAAWAAERLKNEPLTEIKQVKGTSETAPTLSPTDEFASFELMNYLIGIPNSKSNPHGSYAREAFKNGLAMQDERGYNPYKFGFVGAGDAHNTATSYSQSNYFGDHAMIDATPKERLAGKVVAGMTVLETGTSGLGGVWAEENTRASIFDAMKRKETFGTSGVRIKVRLFGGWGYPNDVLEKKDWVKVGYAQGVPMGADLPARTGNESPRFIVWAVKDPVDGNLDRIQIIKGWSKSGQTFEKVYDVVWAGDRKPDPTTGKVPAIGNTVDIKNASYTNTIGATELKQVWKDPDFDPTLNAFYYARVIQIPTPRWSTYDAKKLGVPPPSSVPATIQERAWTSPIWYTPSQARGAGGNRQDRGVTVAEVTAKGGVRLDAAQLNALIVGKAVAVRNTVTGEQFTLEYERNGQYLVQPATATKATQTSEFADLMSNAQHEPVLEYSIQNDKILTKVGDMALHLAVYKEGGRYVAARDTEFGYANYEIIPAKINRVETANGSPQAESDVYGVQNAPLTQRASSLNGGLLDPDALTRD
jgi:hypothetical protein